MYVDFEKLLSAIGIERTDSGGSITLSGEDPVVPSRHKIGLAAGSALAAQGAAIAAIWRMRSGEGQDVAVDMKRAAVLGLRTVYHIRQNGYRHPIPPRVVHPPVDFYKTRDGRQIFILRSTNYVETLLETLDLLDCSFAPESMARAVAGWDGIALEDALNEQRLVGTVSRTRAEWLAHPQGALLASLPPVHVEKISDGPAMPFTSAKRPLSGIKVLDFTHVLAGPITSRTLAEQGAEVLHISPPDRQDPVRGAIDTGLGKRQAYLDLRDEADVERALELAADADILVDSWRPGSLARHGLTPERLAAVNPNLIYVSISCYGSEGPWADRGGYEPCGQVACGLAIDEGSEDAPKLASVGTLNDYLTAYLGAAGALGALVQRAREGGSYRVSASLTRSSMWIQELGRLPEDLWMPPGPLPEPNPDDFEEHDSAFGQIRVASPVTTYSRTSAYWDCMPEPFGASQPAWMSEPDAAKQ